MDTGWLVRGILFTLADLGTIDLFCRAEPPKLAVLGETKTVVDKGLRRLTVATSSYLKSEPVSEVAFVHDAYAVLGSSRHDRSD